MERIKCDEECVECVECVDVEKKIWRVGFGLVWRCSPLMSGGKKDWKK